MKTTTPLAALLFSLALAACGGGADPGTDTASADTTPTAEAATPTATAELASEPAAVPADRAAHTLAGLYLSRKTAQALERDGRSRVLVVTSQPGGDEERELDVRLAFAMQAAQDLPNDAPVLVYGRDLERASELVDRLQFLGFSRVFLVT